MNKICEGKSTRRFLQMDKIWWKDLDREAKKRSKKGKKVFAQDILREIAGKKLGYIEEKKEDEHTK